MGDEPAELRDVEALLNEETGKRGEGAQALIVIGGLVVMFLFLPMAGRTAFFVP